MKSYLQMNYIYNRVGWPNFTFKDDELLDVLSHLSFAQGKLLGKMSSLGFDMQKEASLVSLSQEIMRSSEIEGVVLNLDQVRSSIAKKFNIEYKSSEKESHYVDGIVNMMIDASSNFDKPLTLSRLFSWHASLFPTGYSGMEKINVAKFRTDKDGRMQVISYKQNRKNVHFEAPEAKYIHAEMKKFLLWLNKAPKDIISVAKAHLWFVTLHPFDDGNGRITRAITEMMLSRVESSRYRFYSMSDQIYKKRNDYYDILEKTQRGGLDISNWIRWFANTVLNAIEDSSKQVEGILSKAKFWQNNMDVEFSNDQRKIINRLFDGFEGNLTSSKWAKICKCSNDTAIRNINDLIEKNILRKQGVGRTTQYVLNPTHL